MKGAQRLSLAALGASVAALALGILASENAVWLLPLVVLLALGLLGEIRGSRWSPTVWFMAQAAICGIVRKPPGWALFAITAAVAYWDLSAFDRRTRHAGRIANPRALLRRHLSYLLGALVAGAALGIGALTVRIDSGFAGVLLLGLATLVGLAQLLRSSGPGEVRGAEVRPSETRRARAGSP